MDFIPDNGIDGETVEGLLETHSLAEFKALWPSVCDRVKIRKIIESSQKSKVRRCECY